jgi:DNA-binding beta-propeller fold protein YncE
MPEIRARAANRSMDPRSLAGRRTGVDRRDFLLAAAGTALTFGPRALAGGTGGTPLAFVTADLESHVAVLDLDTTRVVGRIRTGPGPRSIEGVLGRIAVVAHTEYGAVSLIDGVSRRIRRELDSFDAPRYTAVHPTGAVGYVTDSSRGEVVTLDLRRGIVISREHVPGPARHISISPGGETIWTSLGTKASRVAVLDASNARRPRLVRTFAPPFLAHDVGFAPDGEHAWVTSGAERRVAVFRLDERLLRVIDADAAPQHVTFVGNAVFVASGDDGTVRRQTVGGRQLADARVPVGSYNVTFGWGRVITPSLGRGTLSVLDTRARVRAVRRIARAAHDACILVGP